MISSAVKHSRVDLRIQGNQKIYRPELVEKRGRVFFIYEVKGVGIRSGGFYQRSKRVFSWADKPQGHFFSDRSSEFIVPGGKFRTFDILSDGSLHEN